MFSTLCAISAEVSGFMRRVKTDRTGVALADLSFAENIDQCFVFVMLWLIVLFCFAFSAVKCMQFF